MVSRTHTHTHTPHTKHNLQGDVQNTHTHTHTTCRVVSRTHTHTHTPHTHNTTCTVVSRTHTHTPHTKHNLQGGVQNTHTHTQPAGWCLETAKPLPNELYAFCQQQTVFVLLSIESLHSAGGIPVDGNGVISSFPRTLFCNCSPINSSSRRPQGKPVLIVP